MLKCLIIIPHVLPLGVNWLVLASNFKDIWSEQDAVPAPNINIVLLVLVHGVGSYQSSCDLFSHAFWDYRSKERIINEPGRLLTLWHLWIYVSVKEEVRCHCSASAFSSGTSSAPGLLTHSNGSWFQQRIMAILPFKHTVGNRFPAQLQQKFSLFSLGTELYVTKMYCSSRKPLGESVLQMTYFCWLESIKLLFSLYR